MTQTHLTVQEVIQHLERKRSWIPTRLLNALLNHSKFTRRLISKDKNRKLDSTCWGLLTQKLLHLLHTHVNVDARDLVVVVVDAWKADGVSQTGGSFQQQQEEEAAEPPRHRVWPAPGLRRAAGAADRARHGGPLSPCSLRSRSRCSVSVSPVCEVNPGRQHYATAPLWAPTFPLPFCLFLKTPW